MLFDSHCHLDFPVFDADRSQLLTQCADAGIAAICLPATEQQYWARLEQLLRTSHPSGVRLCGALGLHPFFINAHQDLHLEQLDQRLSEKPEHIVAVGEIGLDLFIDEPNLPRQEHLFREQVTIAAHHKLPLILHVRRAHDQTASILRKMKFTEGGIVHAWSGSSQQAKAFTDIGFKIGIGGSLTYDRAARLHKLVRTLPLEHFVLETDAPDIPPAHIKKGERNTPLTLVPVLDKIAELRDEPVAQLQETLYQNTCAVFRISSDWLIHKNIP